jgi:hypothetical protein
MRVFRRLMTLRAGAKAARFLSAPMKHRSPGCTGKAESVNATYRHAYSICVLGFDRDSQ